MARDLQQDAEGNWGYTGAALPMPLVYDMADIPAGGYQQAEVPDPAVWELIEQFDRRYSEMLRLLQEAWTQGDSSFLETAIGKMSAMRTIGRSLMAKLLPNAPGNYGPCFRYVP